MIPRAREAIDQAVMTFYDNRWTNFENTVLPLSVTIKWQSRRGQNDIQPHVGKAIITDPGVRSTIQGCTQKWQHYDNGTSPEPLDIYNCSYHKMMY